MNRLFVVTVGIICSFFAVAAAKADPCDAIPERGPLPACARTNLLRSGCLCWRWGQPLRRGRERSRSLG
jgi:hypothetical protein